MHPREQIAQIGQRVLADETPSRDDLLQLCEYSQDEPHELLYWANRVRAERFGNAVRMCCIVAGKLGGCGEDCKWCAQSKCATPAGEASPPPVPPKAVHTPAETILNAADDALECGSDCIGIVNSGRRPSCDDLDKVLSAIGEIRSRHGERIGVCASLGELTPEQARQLAAAGLHRYHHNLETSRNFYPKMVTSHTYDDRLRTLAAAKAAGMSVCCGGLFGLGESWADRVDLAITLRDEVQPNTVPVNFLHPIPGTALENITPPSPMECLRILALFRLALPGADIKVCGGREHNLRDLQCWSFYAGATSLMTGNYLTTPGRGTQADLQMIRDLGLRVVRE